MKHFELIDWLPEVPEEFLKTPEEVLCASQGVDIGSYKPDDSDYSITVHDTDKELKDFLQPYFKQEISVRWQVITRDVQLHIDWGNSHGKYLYQLLSGGDFVETRFWSKLPDEKNDGGWIDTKGRELVEIARPPLRKWCRLNVKEPHEVIGVESIRFGLLIRPRHD